MCAVRKRGIWGKEERKENCLSGGEKKERDMTVGGFRCPGSLAPPQDPSEAENMVLPPPPPPLFLSRSCSCIMH